MASRLTPAVSRANSRSEARAKAVGVGSSARFGAVWTEPCAPATALGSFVSWSDGRKPHRVDLDLFHHKRLHAQFVPFEQVCQFLAVDEVNGWRSVPHGLRTGITAKGPGGDDETLVCPANHGPAEITNDTGTHRTRIPLTLKNNLEIDQSPKPQDPFAINAAVARASRDLHLRETTLTQ